jgi:Nucleotidyl transferase AbiEii toxin, Type IV TA system
VLSTDNPFCRQVVLLIELLPLVGRESCFALKGGTAINLFVRDLPRLSVDIDLTYLPIEGRAESLRHIEEALHRLGSAIETALRGATTLFPGREGGALHKNSSAPRPRERSDRGIARIAGLRSRT